MRIYQFREPRVPKDDRGRSVKYAPPYVGLPGVSCWGEPGACGEIWTRTLDRIRTELPDDHPLRVMKPWPVPPAELNALRDEVRRALSLPPDVPLYPGTNIGLVRIRRVRPNAPAFEWPAIHTVLINDAAHASLISHGLTGWHTEPVIATDGGEDQPAPDLREFVVDGRGGPAVTQPPAMVRTACSVCGLVKYETGVTERLEVDPAQWDGSDFFRFDPPFDGYIFVSDRAAEALEESSLDNFELVPVDQFLAELRPENRGR